ncbi:hypothetical protein HYV30_03045 [Candidatus Kaiserbacteria bacterium]|nr:hypothetical protein [Candidatus Kaiserbacteria bacterium]
MKSRKLGTIGLHMNTSQKGSVRYMVFKDGGSWYAVGLEFNIVESADDPRIALNNLFDAIRGYVESLKKIKGARMAPLNQKPDTEYERLWAVATAAKPVKSPFKISTFGVANV